MKLVLAIVLLMTLNGCNSLIAAASGNAVCGGGETLFDYSCAPWRD